MHFLYDYANTEFNIVSPWQCSVSKSFAKQINRFFRFAGLSRFLQLEQFADDTLLPGSEPVRGLGHWLAKHYRGCLDSTIAAAGLPQLQHNSLPATLHAAAL